MKPLIIKHTGKNFVQCLEIINRIGTIAESMNHHPDIKLYGYKNLEFTLFTHDVGEVTDKDSVLAKEIEDILIGY